MAYQTELFQMDFLWFDFRSNLPIQRIRSGQYCAPAIRRVHIPMSDGGLRPLSIPTFKDNIVHRAVVLLLEPIYEQDFYDCSFGFHSSCTGKSSSSYYAWEDRWVFNVDLQKYFDTINHQHLRSFLSRRVVDGVIRKLIGKWLKAGVLDQGQLSYQCRRSLLTKTKTIEIPRSVVWDACVAVIAKKRVAGIDDQ